MAFSLNYLLRVGQTKDLDKSLNVKAGMDTQVGPQMWTYNGLATGSNDARAAIIAADYFLSARGYIKQGDFILINANDPAYALLSVTASTALTVTTADITT